MTCGFDPLHLYDLDGLRNVRDFEALANDTLRLAPGAAIYYLEAVAFIAERPGRWLALVARKFFYTWVPVGPSYTLHSTRYFIASVVSYAIVLPFAIAGVRALVRVRARADALWLLAGSALLANLVFFPQERFRTPILDPTLIICASAWLAGRGNPGQPFRVAAQT